LLIDSISFVPRCHVYVDRCWYAKGIWTKWSQN